MEYLTATTYLKPQARYILTLSASSFGDYFFRIQNQLTNNLTEKAVCLTKISNENKFQISSI
jgi:hypothetical protein